MSSQSLFLDDEAATVALGESLGRMLVGGGVVYLEGTLGAGKTTLTRGVLRAFGHQGAVKSPTYTLVEPYELAGQAIYHFDLYRLGEPEELEYMGIRDYFLEYSLCIVEWPERGQGYLPLADIRVQLTVQESGRLATLTAVSDRGKLLMQNYKP